MSNTSPVLKHSLGISFHKGEAPCARQIGPAYRSVVPDRSPANERKPGSIPSRNHLCLSKQCQWAWLNLRTVCDWPNDSFCRPAGEIWKNVHAQSLRFRRLPKWPFFQGRRAGSWRLTRINLVWNSRTPKYRTGMRGRQIGAWRLTLSREHQLIDLLMLNCHEKNCKNYTIHFCRHTYACL